MKIGIIDADLLSRRNHRFPNLACMKISGYYKEQGHEVELLTSYDIISAYDQVYISKVFTDTQVTDNILSLPNVQYGGTGFYFDKAPPLTDEIEHHMPDYHLYDDWVTRQINQGKNPKDFAYYTDYSIGFLTRGCFRKCSFCVNQRYDRVSKHSPLHEFYDPNRKKICLLDDNFLGCPDWKLLLQELQSTGKPFQFKQGLDARLLTDEKCKALFQSKYDGDFIFAFDKIDDTPIIETKLKMIRTHTNKIPKFYVLCGFDSAKRWDAEFWERDLHDTFVRIRILSQYRCLPYIMRHEKYQQSPYKGMYITLARWCNQPSFFKKKSLREFCQADQGQASKRYLAEFEATFPAMREYLDMKFPEPDANTPKGT
jgi:hypothetical protein